MPPVLSTDTFSKPGRCRVGCPPDRDYCAFVDVEASIACDIQCIVHRDDIARESHLRPIQRIDRRFLLGHAFSFRKLPQSR